MSDQAPRFTIRNVSSTNTFRSPKDIQMILNVPQDNSPMFVTMVVTQEGGADLLFSMTYNMFLELRENMDMIEEIAGIKRSETGSE